MKSVKKAEKVAILLNKNCVNFKFFFFYGKFCIFVSLILGDTYETK